MKITKTTPDFLPLETFNFSDEQLIEMYNEVFKTVHSNGFKIGEMKDLLFDLTYQLIDERQENWEEKLKNKLIQFGYPGFKVNYTQKQTAVEWLIFELSKNGLLPDGIPSDIHNQAKEMEKDQSLTMSDYNLEELAKEFAIQQLADPKEYDTSIYAATIQNTYMVGFQKALELLTFKSE